MLDKSKLPENLFYVLMGSVGLLVFFTFAHNLFCNWVFCLIILKKMVGNYWLIQSCWQPTGIGRLVGFSLYAILYLRWAPLHAGCI